MLRLGDLLVDNLMSERKGENDKVNRVHMELRILVKRFEAARGDRMVWKEELEPILSEEQREFIGPYWKVLRVNDGTRKQYTTTISLDKMVKRKFYEKNPKWEKEKILVIRNGKTLELEKPKFGI